jgi:hypothetical protein
MLRLRLANEHVHVVDCLSGVGVDLFSTSIIRHAIH